MVTLLLLPGMDGTGLLFEPFIASLGGEFDVRIVAYPTNEPLDYTELESIARSAIPAEGALVLLGESFSGPIAVSLAAEYSSRVKGLVLCSSFVQNPYPAFSMLRSLAGIVPFGLAPMGVVNYLLLGHFATPRLRRALRQALAQVPHSVLRARLQAVLSVDASAKLAAVKAPVLYLQAKQDRLIPASAAWHVLQVCPSAKLTRLEGPHCLLQAQSSDAAEVVAVFVRNVTSR
jgi:pimeloyl-ACP methyl ester carboxylesterase